jgi:hypothetical protein
MSTNVFHVRPSQVWWWWTNPAIILGTLQLVMVIRGDASPISFWGNLIGAITLPLGGMFLFLKREQVYPPISLTDTTLVVTNFQVVFTMLWEDIDCDRSQCQGKTWRLYRRSQPHLEPVVVKVSMYEEGLSSAISARLLVASPRSGE